jgi:hypothetical protein
VKRLITLCASIGALTLSGHAVALPATSAVLYGTLTSWQESGTPSRSNPGIGSLVQLQIASISDANGGIPCWLDPDACRVTLGPQGGIPPGASPGRISIYIDGSLYLPEYGPLSASCSSGEDATYARAGGTYDHLSRRLCESYRYPDMSVNLSVSGVPFDAEAISPTSLARASGLVAGSGSFGRLEGAGEYGVGNEQVGSYSGTFSIYAVNYLPVPPSLMLMGLGLMGVGAFRKRPNVSASWVRENAEFLDVALRDPATIVAAGASTDRR